MYSVRHKSVFYIALLLLFLNACSNDDEIDSCALEPDPGPCNASFLRYYFDKEEQECKEFTWGGCNGTVPFETMEECMECQGN